MVREDLAPGLQISQAVHAARQFQHEHSDVEAEWFRSSNTVVIVSVSDIDALAELELKAQMSGVRYARFDDLDLSPSFTALAFAPEGKKLCRRLPLALSRRR